MSEKGVSVAYTPEFRTEVVRLRRVGGREIKVTAHGGLRAVSSRAV